MNIRFLPAIVLAITFTAAANSQNSGSAALDGGLGAGQETIGSLVDIFVIGLGNESDFIALSFRKRSRLRVAHCNFARRREMTRQEERALDSVKRARSPGLGARGRRGSLGRELPAAADQVRSLHPLLQLRAPAPGAQHEIPC